MRATIVLTLALSLASLTPAQNRESPALPESFVRLVTATNGLGLTLQRELAPKGNAFVSAASIASALLMVESGAGGETAAEIGRVLGLEGIDPTSEAFRSAVRTLVATLSRSPESESSERRGRRGQMPASLQLTLANALWGQTGHPFAAPFLERLEQDFHAQLHALDFATRPEPSRVAINEEIARQTRGKIENLLAPGSIDTSTLLVLTNAVHFKEVWLHEFSKGATRRVPFHASSEEHFDVDMMHRTGGHLLCETERERVLEIPYGQREHALLIVLPKERHGLSKVESTLSAASFAAWRQGATRQEVALGLPKFRIACPYEVGPALSKLGITHAFDAKRADFTPMDGGAGQLVLSRLVHQTFVAIDEHGTEAAAATAMTLRAGAERSNQPPVPFLVDEPFLFFIVDRATQLVLFSGRCTDPRP